MTGRHLITLMIASLLGAVLLGLSIAAFAAGRGDWLAFFQSPARVGVIVVSLIATGAAVFSGSGGMNPGKKEDQRNRWIFAPLIVLTLGMVVLPPYLDGRNLWAADEAVMPYLGLALFTLGGALRIAPVYVLGRRFTGLVAIQEGHRLHTSGLYRYIRHPSYAGLLLSSAGYVLVFRCWLGLLLVAALLAILLARMNAEERLLEGEFGEEYTSYKRRTWRLMPWVY